ncbi:MAG: aldo/keto reductase [Gemmatimonadetes bacterium]|nr:aldo/keto reductase [Gemmatimonadota bacterium]MDA1102658.1 aldo/keto reductase [Gemmatimonadota bacterium]
MIDRRELSEGYSVSRLIHGGWQFSAGHRLGGSDLDDAIEVLVASADLGVTTFDCADIYTGVEELYGRFLRRWRTTSGAAPIQIHTKFVPDYADLPSVDRQYVERIIDRSLTRLGVERLDLVQYYWWRDDVPGFEQTALWLTDLQAAGKIRHVAGTNLDMARLRRVSDSGVRLVANQVQYSVLDRRPEHGLAAACADNDTWLLAFGAIAGGFLSERWLGAAEPNHHSNRSLVKYRLMIDEFGGWEPYQALLQELSDIAASQEVALSTMALRFVLDQPRVASVIVGATRIGQMNENARAFSCTLSASEHARIRAHLDAACGPEGDVFELERDRDGPHGRIMKYDLNRA